jgi:GAF domain-containing protein
VGGPGLHERWPLYGPAVAGLGVRAVTAVPLQVPGNCLGALCVYSAAPVISDAVAAAAVRVADALTHTVLLPGRGSLDGLFGEADFRAEIHQATGMIAARCGCGIDDAQALLRARAFADGRSVELVARSVLRGETRLW